MVSLKGRDIIQVPLEEAVRQIKTVPPDGELVRIGKSIGLGFGD